MNLSDFYKGKKVLITGHTGFKGAWLSKILIGMGADVCGYALMPQYDENIYSIIELDKSMNSEIGDIRDLINLKKIFDKYSPEIVFHLAAQPIVRDSYLEPVYTYETNVMGTVNVLESIRTSGKVKSAIIVTTDKVYKNNEWCWGYRETDELNGFDPYSNSKSCAELVTSSYIKSFFSESDVKVSTVRAGNVIGGGDFSKDRIIPDCIRSAIKNESIIVRNPYSTRPYQHVLEPLIAYLLIAKEQFDNKNLADVYNIGPNDQDCLQTGELVDLFCKVWGEQSWEHKSTEFSPHEANFLKLDCSKIKNNLKWTPMIDIKKAVNLTVDWHKGYKDGQNVNILMENQIKDYLNELNF